MEIFSYASLIAGWVLMAIAVIWSIAALASPAWQVVDLREYQSIHYHGLWQDCARTFKTGIYAGSDYDTEGALHCTYKFDFRPGQLVPVDGWYVDENSPGGENRYHTWHVYQVVPLVLVMLSVVGGIAAILVSCGTPRMPVCAMISTGISFVCLVLSFAVVGAFFIIAHNADFRFVKGVVGTYEAILGRAYYFELVACIFFLLGFICSLLTAYKFRNGDDSGSRRRVIQRGAPLLDTTPNYVKLVPVMSNEPNGHSPKIQGYESKF